MELLFIRHGEQDYRDLDERGVRGSRRNEAPLTPMGRVQIDAIASDFRLADAEIILSSGYTRAVESAKRLEVKLGKQHVIEPDIHEWLPNKDINAPMTDQEMQNVYEEFRFYTGFPPNGDTSGVIGKSQTPPPANERKWESLDEVRERVIPALLRYQQYKSIIVVSHAVVMASILGVKRYINHAEIIPHVIDPATFTIESFQELEERKAQEAMLTGEKTNGLAVSSSYSLEDILADLEKS